MTNMSHYDDYRGEWNQFRFSNRRFAICQEILGIVHLSIFCDMPHFFYDNHGSILVQHLIDGYHAAHFHQYFNDISRFN